MFTVYVLKSLKDGNRYIGCTKDIQNRLKKHNAGQVRSTKGRRPFHVIHTEEFTTWSEARQREDFLKSGQGRQWLEENNF